MKKGLNKNRVIRTATKGQKQVGDPPTQCTYNPKVIHFAV